MSAHDAWICIAMLSFGQGAVAASRMEGLRTRPEDSPMIPSVREESGGADTMRARAFLLAAAGSLGLSPAATARLRIRIGQAEDALPVEEAVQALALAQKPLTCHLVSVGDTLGLNCRRIDPSEFALRTAGTRNFLAEMLRDAAPAALPHSIVRVDSSAGSLQLSVGALLQFAEEYDLMEFAFSVKAIPGSPRNGEVAILRFSPIHPVDWRQSRPGGP